MGPRIMEHIEQIQYCQIVLFVLLDHIYVQHI